MGLDQRLEDEPMFGHLQHEIKVLRKRLDVAEHDAVLTYDRLSFFILRAVQDVQTDHPRWPTPPEAFADSLRKRFMGLVVGEVRNRTGQNATPKQLTTDECRRLLRDGLSPAKYAELAARVEQEDRDLL